MPTPYRTRRDRARAAATRNHDATADAERDSTTCPRAASTAPTCGPRPICPGCCRPQVLVTCVCHPITGRNWQCADAPLRPGMVRIPLPPVDDFADLVAAEMIK